MPRFDLDRELRRTERDLFNPLAGWQRPANFVTNTDIKSIAELPEGQWAGLPVATPRVSTESLLDGGTVGIFRATQPTKPARTGVPASLFPEIRNALTEPEATRIRNPKQLIFVSEHPLVGANGNERLILDVAKKMADKLHLDLKIVGSKEQVDAALGIDPDALIVAMNQRKANLPWLASYTRNLIRIGVNNGGGNHDHEEILFNPYFDPISSVQRMQAQMVYDVQLLPSRVVPSEPKDIPANPKILFVVKQCGEESLAGIMDTCRKLQEKHGAQFALCTGPGASVENEEMIEQKFKAAFPDADVYLWKKDEGQNNRYTDMIAATDCIVTSPLTLSTGSDLFTSGKMVGYICHDGDRYLFTEGHDTLRERLRTGRVPCGNMNADERFMYTNVLSGLVRVFDENMLDGANQGTDLRRTMAHHFDGVFDQFITDLRAHIEFPAPEPEQVKAASWAQSIMSRLGLGTA